MKSLYAKPMTDVLKALKSANFLVDTNGQRVAVQLNMASWETLLDWVKKQEDTAIVKAAIPRVGAIPLWFS